jgi:hypothetical protein
MNTVETNTRRKVTIREFADEYLLFTIGCRESVDGVVCDPIAKFMQLMRDNGVWRSEELIRIRRKLKDKNNDSHSRVETLKELYNFIDGVYKRLANEYIESSGNKNWTYPENFVASLFLIGIRKMQQKNKLVNS